MFPVFGAYPYFRHDDMTIHWYETDETATVAWNASAGATYYNVRANWIRGDAVLQEYPLGTTANLELVIPAPRAAAFVIGVQACNSSDECSSWAESNNTTYATVDGQPKAWVLIFSLAGTGPIIISTKEERLHG
ncbi:MAG: hypothetical protein ACXADW_20460 [Candidatus Hodarchaeales archaeon]